MYNEVNKIILWGKFVDIYIIFINMYLLKIYFFTFYREIRKILRAYIFCEGKQRPYVKLGNWVYFWTQYKSFQLYKQKVRVWLQLPWGSRLMSVIKLAACNYGFEKEVILTHCIINKASREQRLCHYYISIHAIEMFFVQRWDSFLFSIGRSFFVIKA